MQKPYVQTPLAVIYAEVASAFEMEKPKFLQMIDDYIDFEQLISYEFYRAFYNGFGRPREYSLEGFIRFLCYKKFLVCLLIP